MGKKTSLYATHLASHAKMVDFAGWDLPIHYGSQLAEHQQVREKAGVFDVSHMNVIDIKGKDAGSYLRLLLANNIDKLSLGKALYTCMLNESGCILDDLLVYKLADDFYRVVVNAATGENDLNWMNSHINDFSLTLTKRDDLAIIATQGPKTAEKIAVVFPEHANELRNLKHFHSMTLNDKFVARTGYTGEDGYEWILPQKAAAAFWQKLIDHDFSPCGLGARDTLRLEAGLNLYGTDMDDTVTPLESNLSWTVAFEPKERDFIGRLALEQLLQQGVQRQLVGLMLEEGIPRHHQKVIVDEVGVGEVTSGSFSPTLKKGIALARVSVGIIGDYAVEIRGKKVAAKIVELPFVKK